MAGEGRAFQRRFLPLHPQPQPSHPATLSFLEDNCLTSLAGLGPQATPSLAVLDACGTRVTDAAPLAACAGLETLRLARNPLGARESADAPHPLACLAPLGPTITTLDVADCGLVDGAALLAALAALPHLACLHLAGNPAASAIPGGRLAVVAALPRLTYLDARPVDGGERAAADAWSVVGGVGPGWRWRWR